MSSLTKRIKTTKKFVAVILAIVCALLFIDVVPAQAAYSSQSYPYPSSKHDNATRTDIDNRGYYTSWPSQVPRDGNMQYRTNYRYHDNRGNNNYSYQIPDVTLNQNGSMLYGIDGSGRWVLLTSRFAYGLQIQGNRIAMIDRDHYLVVRDGIYGEWIIESTNFDEYWLSRSVLVERIGTCLYFKARFDDPWTFLSSNVTPGTVTVNGSSIDYTPLYQNGYSVNDQYRYPRN